MRISLFIIVACIAFASCKNCSDRTTGYIVDSDSRYGLSGVRVISFGALNETREDERIISTDSTGYFETFFTSKSTAKCPVLKLIISKQGYKSLELTTLREGDTILLHKIAQ